jgi:hypothetical protein
MSYTKPSFTEIRMDAEIGAYQNDFDDQPLFAAPESAEVESDAAAES